MTTEAWTFTLIILSFMLYLYIGWSARVRESAGFYVAGQGVPALANGAATAADWMSAASFISMAGLISFMGYEGSVYLMGWTGGYVLLALLLAPYLRKFGKYTVPDFVGDRYYSDAARIVAVIAALFVSLTYVVGQMRGVGIVMSRFLGVDIVWGVIIGMAITAFFAVLGGMKGITWTQVAQYFVLIVAFLIPAIAISNVLTGNPVPQLAFTTSDIVTRLNQIQTDLGFGEYTAAFTSKTKLDVLCITLALMVGTAGLPHVIVRFYTVKNVRAARWSAGWALLFIAMLYTTAPALAAFARYNLIDSLNGARITDTSAGVNGGAPIYGLTKDGTDLDYTWTEKWQRTNLLAFVDKNGDGLLTIAPGNAFAMAGNKPNFAQADTSNPNEVFIDADIIVLSTPEVASLAPWVVGLVAAGGLAAALSTAAGLLLVISSSIAHDIYYRLINPNATETQRVFVGRIFVIVGIIAAGYFGIYPPAFVGEVVAFAFGLAAASFFPVILLGIFDKRTNREGAIAGMITGLGFTGYYIIANRFFGMEPWCFGISAQGIGTVGMVLNFVVALVVSRLTPPPPPEVQAMVEELRIPAHPGLAQVLDESHI